MNRSRLAGLARHSRHLLAATAIAATAALAGCNTDGNPSVNAKALKPLSDKMISDIESRNMDKASPILVRVFKEESELEVWKKDRNGQFALLKTYPICRWSGELGPKVKQGDRQAPEGFYTINPGQMNPNSSYYLSFDLGYPNNFDKAHGRTGSHLMVHGDCSSAGCYSMTDEQISEIYGLGREAFFGGQRSFQVQAYPFKMTPTNFARHRSNPNMAFWKMLKQGNDHFEVTKQEVKVAVCDKRYVFDAQNPDDPNRPLNFTPAAKCPVYEVPSDIMAAVQSKTDRDNTQVAELVRKGTTQAPIKTNADGGMHPVFAEVVKQRTDPNSNSTFRLASAAPGTVPSHTVPPRANAPAEQPGFSLASAFSSAEPIAAPALAPVRTASADPSVGASAPAAPAAANSGSPGNMFGNLFGSSSSAVGATTIGANPLDRMAKLIGIRGQEEAKPDPAKAKPAPAPQRARAPGAIRPQQKPAGEPEIRTAAAQPAAPAVSAPSASLMAAPASSSGGSFDSRWSAFR